MNGKAVNPRWEGTNPKGVMHRSAINWLYYAFIFLSFNYLMAQWPITRCCRDLSTAPSTMAELYEMIVPIGRPPTKSLMLAFAEINLWEQIIVDIFRVDADCNCRGSAFTPT